MGTRLLFAAALLAWPGWALAAAITDVRFEQDPQGLVHIRYWLDAARAERFEVGFKASDDGGKTFSLVPTALTGDAGPVSGSGEKHAVWDVEKDHPELFGDDYVIAVEARPAGSAGARLLETMSLVPAGMSWMGSPDGEGGADEHPRRRVSVGAFFMDKTLVTVAQYRKFRAASGQAMMDQPVWNKDEHPVVSVSWEEAAAYCAWAGKRLPTEAEWEKAARGGAEGLYSFGDSEKELVNHAWFSNNSGGRTHPVAEKKANPYGLYDMHGNVWEWVSDWYADRYDLNSADKNPQGPSSGSMRVLRGGSWSSFAAKCRAASRSWFFPDGRDPNNGFRCAAPAAK